MTALSIAFVLVGFAACYTSWKIGSAIGGKLNTYIDRYLSLMERQTMPARGAGTDEPVPDDVVAHILSTRGAVWAQDQEMAFAREQYRVLGDWPKVRVVLGMTGESS